jgi:alpha-tubulin suppressor-like RCC1 family protein
MVPTRGRHDLASRAAASLLLLTLAGAVGCKDSKGTGDVVADAPIGDIAADTADVRLPPDKPVSAVSCGDGATCAIADGEVWCWGGAWECRLDPAATLPRRVAGIDDLVGVDVAGGSYGASTYACAVTAAGRVWCWDLLPEDGIEMAGADAGPWTAALVEGPTDIVEVKLGYGADCALDSSGAVWCWGMFGDFGALVLEFAEPEIVALPEPAVDLAVGHRSACAVTVSGDVWCWGETHIAPPPEPESETVAGPFKIELSDPVDRVAVGSFEACAARVDGDVVCWGPVSPPSVEAEWDRPGKSDAELTQFDAHDLRFCARYGDGSAWCWWRNIDGMHDIESPWEEPVSLVSTSDDHRCAVASDGRLLCSGDNSSGELGQGVSGSAPMLTKTDLQLAADLRAFATSADMTCEVTGGGEIRCWGALQDPSHGYLSGTHMGTHPCPESGEEWVSVSTGGETWGPDSHRACGITTSGSVWCGAFDLGTPPELVQWRQIVLPSSATVVVEAGWPVDCALVGDGITWCWEAIDANPGPKGPEAYWLTEAGSGHTALACNYGNCAATGPEAGTVHFEWQWGGAEWEVETFHGLRAVAVAAGEASVCVLTVTGNVACWGANDVCECGIPWGTEEYRALEEPTDVPLPGKATAIAAGQFFTCAALENGDIYCWGEVGGFCTFVAEGEEVPCQPVLAGSLGAPPGVFAAAHNHLLAGTTPGDLWFLGTNDLGEIPGGPLVYFEDPVEVVIP